MRTSKIKATLFAVLFTVTCFGFSKNLEARWAYQFNTYNPETENTQQQRQELPSWAVEKIANIQGSAIVAEVERNAKLNEQLDKANIDGILQRQKIKDKYEAILLRRQAAYEDKLIELDIERQTKFWEKNADIIDEHFRKSVELENKEKRAQQEYENLVNWCSRKWNSTAKYNFESYDKCSGIYHQLMRNELLNRRQARSAQTDALIEENKRISDNWAHNWNARKAYYYNNQRM